MISSSTLFQVRFRCRFCMWSCVQTHIHNLQGWNKNDYNLTRDHCIAGLQSNKDVHGSITNDCNLTREPCIVSLHSNKTSKRALYTPTILHTLHTRPGIDSHMSRKGNSQTERRVDTSAERSAPTHKAAMWSCVKTHVHNRQGCITNDWNLTRDPCIAGLQSNKNKLHTRPGIDSHMSREGSLTS
jgi:hypothetical protein